jgi:hypothetical protein
VTLRQINNQAWCDTAPGIFFAGIFMSYDQYLTPEIIQAARLTPRQVARRAGFLKRQNFATNFSITCGTGKISLLLGRGMVAAIDTADYPVVSQFNWRAMNNSRGAKPCWYAYTSGVRPDGQKTHTLYLHLLLLGTPPDGKMVDHANGDSLDNRRFNLRFATPRENSHNRSRHRRPRNYTGVRQLPNGEWSAAITSAGRLYNIGTFRFEIEAALARDWAAKLLVGRFAKLNVPEISDKSFIPNRVFSGYYELKRLEQLVAHGSSHTVINLPIATTATAA